MRFRRIPRFVVAALLGFTLIGASCGVSRTASDETLAEETSTVPSAQEESSGEEADETTTTPTSQPVEPTPPPTTAPASDVAFTIDFGDEVREVTHGQVNDVIIPTWENDEFVSLAFGGVVPPGFYNGVVNEVLVGEVFDYELSNLNGTVDDADVQAARDNLMGIMQSWYPADGDPVGSANAIYEQVPYLPFLVNLQASQAGISTALEASGALNAEVPCVRHILLDDEATAQEVLDLLADGGDFATLATEYSTGPSGPNGGDLGCAASSGYVPEFATAVDTAELGEFVGPVQTQFGWHVLVVERYEETVQDPTQVLNDYVRNALGSVSVDVDPRLGSWDPNGLSIVPASSE